MSQSLLQQRALVALTLNKPGVILVRKTHQLEQVGILLQIPEVLRTEGLHLNIFLDVLQAW